MFKWVRVRRSEQEENSDGWLRRQDTVPFISDKKQRGSELNGVTSSWLVVICYLRMWCGLTNALCSLSPIAGWHSGRKGQPVVYRMRPKHPPKVHVQCMGRHIKARSNPSRGVHRHHERNSICWHIKASLIPFLKKVVSWWASFYDGQ